MEMMAISQPSMFNIQQPTPIEANQISDMEHDQIMDKAKSCCVMQGCDLFDMCAELCGINPGMTKACAELCACVVDHDIYGVCSCLEEICSLSLIHI